MATHFAEHFGECLQRGSQWSAMIVYASSVSHISVIPKQSWPALSFMERALFEETLVEEGEPQSGHSYLAFVDGRPVRVICQLPHGNRYTVLLTDFFVAAIVDKLFGLPRRYSLKNVPSFALRVSLTNPSKYAANSAVIKKILKQNPIVEVLVTKSGKDNYDPPEVVFLDEDFEILIDEPINLSDNYLY